MSLLYSITLLVAMLPLEVRDFLREPNYSVTRDGDHWAVQKPRIASRHPTTISQHQDRSAAQFTQEKPAAPAAERSVRAL